MDEMSEGVATLAENGGVAYCNLRFASIVGLPAERVVGASVNRIVPADAWDRLTALLHAGLLAVSKGEFQLRRESGPQAAVLLSVCTVEMDGKVALCVIATDVTEEKRREQEVAADRAEREAALRASEERYRRIVETAVEGIWLVDAEGRTTFANRALSEMLGYPPEELTGRLLFDFMDEESVTAARRFLSRNRRHSEMRELGFRTRSGRKLQVQLADRMSSLGTLSAGVAHEINNPLAYLIASLDLLASRLRSGGPSSTSSSSAPAKEPGGSGVSSATSSPSRAPTRRRLPPPTCASRSTPLSRWRSTRSSTARGW